MAQKIADELSTVTKLSSEIKVDENSEICTIINKIKELNSLISQYAAELNIREKELALKQKELRKIQISQNVYANTLEYFEDSLDDYAKQLENREILITAREKALEHPE
ncbi:hypothetical protein PV-S19_0161 [Pacmanvirus S19]|nr:hypothetical protein PV-S19_0161 [Pacmanvirus S19]